MRNVDLAQSVHDRIVQARVNSRLFGGKLRASGLLLNVDRFLALVTGGAIAGTVASKGEQWWAIVTLVSFLLGQFVKAFKTANMHGQYERLRRAWVKIEADLMLIQDELEMISPEQLAERVGLELVGTFRAAEQKIMLLQEMEPPLGPRDESNLKILQEQVEKELEDKREPFNALQR